MSVEHDNKRKAIQNLQRYLRQLSYFNEEILEPPIDGIFERDTEEALRAFQRSASLPPTGRADRETFERLYEAYLASLAARAEPLRIPHFPQIPEDYTVEVGDTQFWVQIIQNALHELSSVYDELENVSQSGVYDADTATAVRAFQRIHGLPATGAVDRTTWNALAEAYNRNLNRSYWRQ